MMFAQIAVLLLFCRYGDADGRYNEPIRLICAVFTDDAIDDFAGPQHAEAFLFRNDAASRWEDAGDTNEVVHFYPRLSEGRFEGSQFLLMFSHPLGEKDLARNHGSSPPLLIQHVLPFGKGSLCLMMRHFPCGQFIGPLRCITT